MDERDLLMFIQVTCRVDSACHGSGIEAGPSKAVPAPSLIHHLR